VVDEALAQTVHGHVDRLPRWESSVGPGNSPDGREDQVLPLAIGIGELEMADDLLDFCQRDPIR
jgi:hypothetical protein